MAATHAVSPVTTRARAPCLERLGRLDLAAGVDEDVDERLVAAVGARVLDGVHDLHALDDLAEDDVLAVQVRRGHRRDEELRAVGVGARVGHREQSGARVLDHEVLVRERAAVDGHGAGAVAGKDVAALQHEAADHAVEGHALVRQRRVIDAAAVAASRQGAEVGRCLGHDVVVELELNAAKGRLAGLDVEEDVGEGLRDLGERAAGSLEHAHWSVRVCVREVEIACEEGSAMKYE